MTGENHKEPNDSRTESMNGSPGDADKPRIERLGPFRLEATLGVGGMGTIYRAYDESMKRTVALKVLHASLEISKSAQARFVREAWIAGRLDHPNIIKVYTRGEENRVSYIAMELAESGSLSDYIKQTSKSIPSGADVSETTDRNYINLILEKFIGLAQALEHIHSKDFIHRDIKPHNILLAGPDRDFKLTDFGIAHAEDMTRMTRAGDFIGTVRYMSPELIAAHRGEVDKRTDIYSLGVTLYEALTLTLPFKAVSEEKLISEILAGHYIEARKTNRRISRDLETVLMKATHHDPDLRYQTAIDFTEDLQRIIDGRPILARRQSAFSKGIRYVRRNYKAVMAVTAAAVILIATVLWSFYRAVRTNGPEVDKPTFTTIDVPGLRDYCAVSPDGEMLTFVADDSCLWVAPTRGLADSTMAGEPVRLTEPIDCAPLSSLPVWSADGKWIAFNARGERDSVSGYRLSMCVIASTGGDLIEVPVRPDGLRWYNFRISLSPDGKNIAFSSHTSPIPGDSRTDCIYSIPIGGGEIKRLTDTLCWQPAYSPDGKMLAYVKGDQYFRIANDSMKCDIWVVPVEGGPPLQVTDLPGAEFGPVWSPDSRMIAFSQWTEAESGGYEIREMYVAALSETYVPVGPPINIELPLPSDDFIGGWNSKNEIGLVLETPGHVAVYTLPASGGIATQITPSYSKSPSWSPDGERIFYLTDSAVYSAPAEGGQGSIVPITGMEELGYANCDVSPDGKSLVFPGVKAGDSTLNIFTVSISGGEPDQLTFDPLEDWYPRWSPDGKWIAFERDENFRHNLCVVPAEGGEVRKLLVSTDSFGYSDGLIDWSPDGKFIVYPSYHDDSLRGISVVPLEGGHPEVIAELDPGYTYISVSWSPDGRKLAYCSYARAYGIESQDIWILPLDTRRPFKLRIGRDLDAVVGVDWSPDGERIAFWGGQSPRNALCFIKDFLPE